MLPRAYALHAQNGATEWLTRNESAVPGAGRVTPIALETDGVPETEDSISKRK
jgi:hypothetical protein